MRANQRPSIYTEPGTPPNSTFITPFDREDIYALAAQLDDVVDAVEEAADMLVLHKVEEPIEPVREQARIIRRAARRPPKGCATCASST
jgi:uncharacterized protein Yka (UPF0111/DUF47 family)